MPDFEREQRVVDLPNCVFGDWLGDSAGARRLVEIIGSAEKRELDGVAGFREVADAPVPAYSFQIGEDGFDAAPDVPDQTIAQALAWG